VLVYSPDRLARKFAYQVLLVEEFAGAGTRVEFVNGPRGDSLEDQLLVQFQGMFAEYEKAQLMERCRRSLAAAASSRNRAAARRRSGSQQSTGTRAGASGTSHSISRVKNPRSAQSRSLMVCRCSGPPRAAGRSASQSL